MENITVLCWLWAGNRDYRPEHVNVLQRMVARNLTLPHRFVCIADRPDGLSDAVEWLETPEAARKAGELETPEGSAFPSCYRRLWTFSDEARVLGDKVLLLDIDLVVTGRLNHLFEYDAPLVGWRPKLVWGPPRVAGGIYLHRTGTLTHVWEGFGPDAPAEARRAGYRGSDQAWISYNLAERCELFRPGHGIESVRDVPRGCLPPPNTCIVQFNGQRKPWHDRRPAWVKEAWK